MTHITLTATHKAISVHTYVQVWKLVKQNPEQSFAHGLTTWWPQTGWEIYKDYTKALHDRINGRAAGHYLPINSKS